MDNRLQFAKNHMSWTTKWRKVIFSDEKKFNLDGPDGCHCYWHDLRDKPEIRMSRNFGGGSVMIWGAFGYGGKMPILYVPPKMNSQTYLEMLEYALDEFADDVGGPGFIFQQDNAAVHSAKVVKEYFSLTSTPVLEWPSRSPDLNPVENLWGRMAQKVYENGRQYNTVNNLKQSIQDVWKNLEMDYLQNLINSMPSRIFEVIRNKGGNTHY